MPENMGHDILAKPCRLAGRAEALLDADHGLPVPLDHVFLRNLRAVRVAQVRRRIAPAPEMDKQSTRDRNGGLALLGLLRTWCAPVKYASLKIDVTGPGCRSDCCCAYCGAARARVERYEDKPCKVPTGAPLRFLTLP